MEGDAAVDLLQGSSGKVFSNTFRREALTEAANDGVQGDAAAGDPIGAFYTT